ncbi:amidoligase family protein [Starkeya koreensis]|uniref:Amidoligase family protein n=1 Tax=Ancylobacter koreensis TaxID=266121 RepID=A0ABT0DJM6_9HYPH|nr:amidoligase family protein [Ancylobacter koreensis]MCK0207477.1 amidoligase family protein [Ancylobacter koreensis]
MKDSPYRFQPLPVPLGPDGVPRRIGVEIEFTRLSECAAALCLAGALGGVVVEEGPHAFRVDGSRLGSLGVELDMRHVHPQRADYPLPWLRPVAGWLGAAVHPFVPRELVTGPLLPESLPALDAALEPLRRAGAAGDGANAFGSLGLHFNIAAAAPDAARVLTVLQAFLLLEARLRAQSLTSPAARWHAPAPYPAGYAARVLSPAYRPDLRQLADDYVLANPTRHRALDLLPLFLHLFPEHVAPRIRGKAKPRAVLHYRLPVAHVGRPGWSLAPDWNRWVEVEQFAADPERLAAALRDGADARAT